MRTGGTDTRFILAVLAAAALLLALLPVARHADEASSRQRPMYEDLARVEWLEYRAMQETGSAVPVDVEGDEPVSIGAESFRPSPGVRVVVEVSAPEQYCARVSNSHGDLSAWHCFDPERPPTDPDRATGG